MRSSFLFPMEQRRSRRVRAIRWTVPGMLLLATMLAAPELAAAGATSPAATPAGTEVPASCPVTIPNGDVPPFGNVGFFPGPVFHGEHGIWASFGPDGTVAWTPAMGMTEGGYGIKFLWYHEQRAKGKLSITGADLGGEAPPLVAQVPGGYGSVGYRASGLIFSRLGCWRITASAGCSSMTFTIWLLEGEPTSLLPTWTSPTSPPYCHVTPQPTRVNPVALAIGPAGTVAVGNDELVAFLPPDGAFEVTASHALMDSLSTPFHGLTLTWWQDPLCDAAPLISGEHTTGWGGSGAIDYDLDPLPATGIRHTPSAFFSPGCWQIE